MLGGFSALLIPELLSILTVTIGVNNINLCLKSLSCCFLSADKCQGNDKQCLDPLCHCLRPCFSCDLSLSVTPLHLTWPSAGTGVMRDRFLDMQCHARRQILNESLVTFAACSCSFFASFIYIYIFICLFVCYMLHKHLSSGCIWGTGWFGIHSESRAFIWRRVLSNGTEDQLLTYIKCSCRPGVYGLLQIQLYVVAQQLTGMRHFQWS